MKLNRVSVTVAFLLMSAIATAWAATSRTPEQMALDDFAARNGAVKRSASQAAAPLRLEEAVLPLHELQNGMVTERAETLRFVWREEELEGFVVMAADRPARMAGKNRATDLAQLYQFALAARAAGEQVCYLELDGQGAFAVRTNEETVVYLSRSAAGLLQLPAHEALRLAQVQRAYEQRKL